MNHFENLQSTAVDLERLAAHLGPSAIAQPRSLKTRGLLLSQDILRWLDARLRAIPQITGDAASQYREKTFPLFVRKFGGRIIEIRNDLAARGLTNPLLDTIHEDMQFQGISPDYVVRETAEVIEQLALEIPPGETERPYKGFSDARIAQLAIDEADKLDSLLKDFQDNVRKGMSYQMAHHFFNVAFNTCCRDVIRNLHIELLIRIPSAKDAEVEDMFPLMLAEPQSGDVVVASELCASWLRMTAAKLRSRVS